MKDIIEILTPIIVAIIPTIATLITSNHQKRENRMFSAKQSILQMQMEDVISVELLHKVPYNYTNIHYEYDKYKKNGGNSDIDEKMKEYEEWHNSLKIKEKRG